MAFPYFQFLLLTQVYPRVKTIRIGWRFRSNVTTYVYGFLYFYRVVISSTVTITVNVVQIVPCASAGIVSTLLFSGPTSIVWNYRFISIVIAMCCATFRLKSRKKSIRSRSRVEEWLISFYGDSQYVFRAIKYFIRYGFCFLFYSIIPVYVLGLYLGFVYSDYPWHYLRDRYVAIFIVVVCGFDQATYHVIPPVRVWSYNFWVYSFNLSFFRCNYRDGYISYFCYDIIYNSLRVMFNKVIDVVVVFWDFGRAGVV